MKKPKNRSRGRSWLIVLALALLLFFTRTSWLGWLGGALIESGEPRRADAILVLAGDAWGNRIRKGGDLSRQGYAPLVFVSGPEGLYGFHESELAIRYAVKHGYPQDMFVALPNTARSTVEEADQIVPELEKRGVKSLILVTSNYHTRRAASTFRKRAAAMSITVVAAPDRVFDPANWWQSRDGQKQWFFEVTKTVASVLGI
ncbi:MAG: YdcF family protein [Bryobacteraceae bacterium]|nr:YdcF family protein [Bryobacteraceae bacterium]